MTYSDLKVMYYKTYWKLHVCEILVESKHFTVGVGWPTSLFARSYKNVTLTGYFLCVSSISSEKEPPDSCFRKEVTADFLGFEQGRQGGLCSYSLYML